MSATGRNLEGNERHALDFYETEGWVTRSILDVIPIEGTVFDAGCGTGAILREVLRDQYPRGSRVTVTVATGLELDPQRVKQANEDPITNGYVMCGDFLRADVEALRTWDYVIANPPYAQAEAFLDRAREIGTTVIFLLRLNFLGSQKRAAKFARYMPDVYVLPKRPSFTGDGRTDATEYAWFVWGDPKRPENSDRFGGVSILNIPEDACRTTKKKTPQP